jgi:putative phage-type endonuclease
MDDLFDNSDGEKDNKVVKKGGFGNFNNMGDLFDNSDGEKDNKVVKKGGFGNFNNMDDKKEKYISKTNKSKGIKTQSPRDKSLFSNISNYKKKEFGRFKQNNITNIQTEYNYPIENNYTGVYRKNDPNELYGPYGTDNYHDKVKSDILNNDEKRRVGIYRKLAAKYYPAQRSEAWFALRNKMITASDGGTVVGLNPYEHKFGFTSKKVHGKPFQTSVDCYHGKKYEEIATMSYEYRMNVRVREFGLCQHPVHNFLGASPDGIVCEYKLRTKDGRSWKDIEKEFEHLINIPLDATPEATEMIMNDNNEIERRNRIIADKYGVKTKFVGRMLEIKCPRRRKILMDLLAPEVYGPHGEIIIDLKKDVKKGVCPAYYWVQVQLQLQCCELDECDFWQCEISEYMDKDDFLSDTDAIHPWLSKETGHEKGAVIQLMPIDKINDPTMDYNNRIYNFAEFIYQPKVDMTPLEIDNWINSSIQKLNNTHEGFVLERILYWKIDKTRNITIQRDDKWFADNLQTFKQAWDYVEYFRANTDKANLLKRYFDSQPTDYYGNIKKTVCDEVMETMINIFNEPDRKESKKYKKYSKFISKLDKSLKKAGYIDPPEYDSTDDVKYIKNSLKFKIPDDLDENNRTKYIKKYETFIKNIKSQVDDYVFEQEE